MSKNKTKGSKLQYTVKDAINSLFNEYSDIVEINRHKVKGVSKGRFKDLMKPVLKKLDEEGLLADVAAEWMYL